MAMKEKIVLITGVTAGIGRATALELAKKEATVVTINRNKEKSERVVDEIRQKSGNDKVDYLVADLSSRKQVRRVADEFKSRFDKLHVLINNAGVIPPERKETEDGFELQFAVNHLAPFLLTNLLIDQLKDSAPSRIVTVSSSAHSHTSLDFDDLQSEEEYDPNEVYSRTKLANVLFTRELAKRLQGTGVTANCLTPGMVKTKMLEQYMGSSTASGASPKEGAETPVYLATSPEVESVTGQYFENNRAVAPSREAQDDETAKKLWRVSAELTGLEETI